MWLLTPGGARHKRYGVTLEDDHATPLCNRDAVTQSAAWWACMTACKHACTTDSPVVLNVHFVPNYLNHFILSRFHLSTWKSRLPEKPESCDHLDLEPSSHLGVSRVRRE